VRVCDGHSALRAVTLDHRNGQSPIIVGGEDLIVPTALLGPLTQAIVTSVGHWRGEGLALVEKIH
jgi:hypothetical protein